MFYYLNKSDPTLQGLHIPQEKVILNSRFFYGVKHRILPTIVWLGQVPIQALSERCKI